MLNDQVVLVLKDKGCDVDAWDRLYRTVSGYLTLDPSTLVECSGAAS